MSWNPYYPADLTGYYPGNVAGSQALGTVDNNVLAQALGINLADPNIQSRIADSGMSLQDIYTMATGAIPQNPTPTGYGNASTLASLSGGTREPTPQEQTIDQLVGFYGSVGDTPGFQTLATEAGINPQDIADLSRHRSDQYQGTSSGELWRQFGAGALGTAGLFAGGLAAAGALGGGAAAAGEAAANLGGTLGGGVGGAAAGGVGGGALAPIVTGASMLPGGIASIGAAATAPFAGAIPAMASMPSLAGLGALSPITTGASTLPGGVPSVEAAGAAPFAGGEIPPMANMPSLFGERLRQALGSFGNALSSGALPEVGGGYAQGGGIDNSALMQMMSQLLQRQRTPTPQGPTGPRYRPYG